MNWKGWGGQMMHLGLELGGVAYWIANEKAPATAPLDCGDDWGHPYPCILALLALSLFVLTPSKKNRYLLAFPLDHDLAHDLGPRSLTTRKTQNENPTIRS
jgi:hypothetical protein